MWPPWRWRIKTRGFCGLYSIAVIAIDSIARHGAQPCVPALNPRLRERGPQNCAWLRAELRRQVLIQVA